MADPSFDAGVAAEPDPAEPSRGLHVAGQAAEPDRAAPAAEPGAATVTVRYFAGARAAAGLEQEVLPLPSPATLDQLADQLATRHGTALGRVLAASTFLIDEVTGGRQRFVPAGATVDVLPPFAGG